jgi:hypothetical protein
MGDMTRPDVIAAVGEVDSTDLSAAGSAECADLLRSTKLIRGWLDAREAQITSRMTELYETAGAAPAADVHTRCGGVSAAAGKRKELRSKTLDEARRSETRSPKGASGPNTSMHSPTRPPSSTRT